MSSSWFKKYLLPGFVFQSVVIAGGYGTGRELVEFFLSQGPLGGLFAVGVATLVWSIVCAATFEFARIFMAYDYRHFFKRLLGRGWVLYEITYVLMILIVLAVVAASAGEILQETFGINYWIGVIGMMAAVLFLLFKGSDLIEKFLAAWSFLLYATFLVFFIWCFQSFGDDIIANFGAEPVGGGWFTAGVAYAGYNLGVIPAVLFTLRHAQRRKEAVTAGLLAGVIGIVPGLLFYLILVGQYPQVLDQSVPVNFTLAVLGSRGFQIFYQVVLFGTLIETGTGLIHAINERVAGVYHERARELPAWIRPAVALVILGIATFLAQFGLIGLIARGYGTITWAFIVIFVIPILTYGIWKIRNANAPGDRAAETV